MCTKCPNFQIKFKMLYDSEDINFLDTDLVKANVCSSKKADKTKDAFIDYVAPGVNPPAEPVLCKKCRKRSAELNAAIDAISAKVDKKVQAAIDQARKDVGKIMVAPVK